MYAHAASPGVDARSRTQQVLEQAAGAVDGDERRRLLDDVVVLNLPLARSLASRYAGRGEPFDDLVQVASLALVRAVRNYDPGRGGEFVAYAYPSILGELKRHFRDRGWSVRPPRRIHDLHLDLAAAREDLTCELGRSPMVRELAARLDADEESVIEALVAAQNYAVESLNAEDGAGAAARETLGREDPDLGWIEDWMVLRPGIEQLTPRERLILGERFVRGCTQRQIAAQIGVSQMQVSRLLGQILSTLRDSCDG